MDKSQKNPSDDPPRADKKRGEDSRGISSDVSAVNAGEPSSAGATLGEVASLVARLAPPHLAYDWDNVGLQIGDPSQRVRRVAVGLEVTDALIEFATAQHCEAVITHHPLIFRPTKSLLASNPAQGRVLELVRRGIGLIVAHTNLDRVLEGTNGILARRMGLENLQILEPEPLVDSYKVVVFVPPDYTQKLIEAFHRAGAGRIGNYAKCTFRTSGTGTYEGDGGTNPFFGESGRLEQATEDRLECLVPAARLGAVMAELRAAHPYEEMAADVVPVHDWSMPFGLGVVGEFPGQRRPLQDVAELLKKATGAEFLQQVGKRPSKGVRRVGVITGSPGPAIFRCRKAGVDLLVTGEMGYHLAMDAADEGLTVLLCGHAASERIFAREFGGQLQAAAKKGIALEFLPMEKFPEPFALLV